LKCEELRDARGVRIVGVLIPNAMGSRFSNVNGLIVLIYGNRDDTTSSVVVLLLPNPIGVFGIRELLSCILIQEPAIEALRELSKSDL